MSKYFPDLQDGKDKASVEPIKSAFEAVESDYEQVSKQVTNLDDSVVGLQADKAEKEDFDVLNKKVYNMDIALTDAQVDVQQNRKAIDALKESTASKDALYYNYSGIGNITPSPASDFSYYIQDGVACITGYNGSDTTVVVPWQIDGLPVNYYLEIMAFYNNTTIETVYLPKNITYLGSNAFQGCTNLKNVFAYGLYVGPNAFQDCTALTNLNFTIDLIELEAFIGCSKLTTVNLSQIRNDTIPQYSFRSCTSLKNLIIPNGVETIQQGIVRDCSALESITIPPSVTSIYHSDLSFDPGDAFENIPDDTIFYVDEGSYADTYCKAQGYNIQYTSIKGDGNSAYAKKDEVVDLVLSALPNAEEVSY